MAAFRDVKTMDDQISKLAHGFCRNIYDSFPSDNTYYSVQSDIINICAVFYWPLHLRIGDKMQFTSLKDAVHGTIKQVMIRDYDNDSSYDDNVYFNVQSAIKNKGGYSNQSPMPKLDFKIDDRVKLARGETGIVKYIGEVEFAKGEIIGLVLDSFTPVGHNGTVRGKKYFEAQDGKGYFTRRLSIENIVAFGNEEVPNIYKLHAINIGNGGNSDSSSVTDKKGTVRFIGCPKQDKNKDSNSDTEEVIGIELINEKLEEMRKCLRLGDTVMINGNRMGHVKYIGPVTGQTEMIGIQLRSWSPDGKDARFDGFRYFTCPDGRGVFVKREGILDIIPLHQH